MSSEESPVAEKRRENRNNDIFVLLQMCREGSCVSRAGTPPQEKRSISEAYSFLLVPVSVTVIHGEAFVRTLTQLEFRSRDFSLQPENRTSKKTYGKLIQIRGSEYLDQTSGKRRTAPAPKAAAADPNVDSAR